MLNANQTNKVIKKACLLFNCMDFKNFLVHLSPTAKTYTHKAQNHQRNNLEELSRFLDDMQKCYKRSTPKRPLKLTGPGQFDQWPSSFFNLIGSTKSSPTE